MSHCLRFSKSEFKVENVYWMFTRISLWLQSVLLIKKLVLPSTSTKSYLGYTVKSSGTVKMTIGITNKKTRITEYIQETFSTLNPDLLNLKQWLLFLWAV